MMTQGELAFKYEMDHQGAGMTGGWEESEPTLTLPADRGW